RKDVFCRGEHEDVALELEELRIRGFVAAEARELAMLVAPRVDRREVEALRIEDSPADVGDGDDARPLSGQLVRGDGANLPVPLHDARSAFETPAEAVHGLVDHHDDSDSRRLGPEARAADGARP